MCLGLRAELEADKVCDVVVDHLAFLDSCPAPETNTRTHTYSQHPLHNYTIPTQVEHT